MGRIPTLEEPKAALGLVRPRHREIMRRLVCGQTQREIARELGLNEGRLSIIVNSPLFKAELSKMERDVRQRAVENIGDVTTRIAKLQTPALDVLEEIVTDKEKKIPYSTKRNAAMDILELAGVKKDKNEDGMSDFAQFITEAFNEAKARAFDRLNKELEVETQRNSLTRGSDTEEADTFAVDITEDVKEVEVSADDAEDDALASFSFPEKTPEETPDHRPQTTDSEFTDLQALKTAQTALKLNEVFKKLSEQTSLRPSGEVTQEASVETEVPPSSSFQRSTDASFSSLEKKNGVCKTNGGGKTNGRQYQKMSIQELLAEVMNIEGRDPEELRKLLAS